MDSFGVTEQGSSVTVHALEDGLHEVLGEEEIAQYSDEADKMSEKLLEHYKMWSGVLNTHVSRVKAIELSANGRLPID